MTNCELSEMINPYLNFFYMIKSENKSASTVLKEFPISHNSDKGHVDNVCVNVYIHIQMKL